VTADQPDVKFSPFDRHSSGFQKVSEDDMKLLRKEVKPSFPDRPVDPVKRMHRAKVIFRSIIKQAVIESVKNPDTPNLTETMIRQAMKDRERRQKIAKKRGIEPGSRRWRALVRDTVRRRRKSG